jgi:hypothetical protein
VTADVKVFPKIESELDVDKLSRLFALIQVLSTIMPQSDATNTVDISVANRDEPKRSSSMQASYATSNNTSLTNSSKYKLKRRRKKASSHDRYSDDMDDVTNLLELRVDMPSLNLGLIYDNSTDVPSSLAFSMHDVIFSLTNRAYDMSVQFELGMVQVSDSLRACSQSCLVRSTPHEHFPSNTEARSSDNQPSKNSKLINISVQMVKSNRSPLYDPLHCCGMVVEAEFGQLFLIFDPSSFLHFRPFYEVLISSQQKKSVPSTTKKALTSPAVEDESPINGNVPSGLTLTLRFQELSLSLLQHNNFNYTRKIPLNQIFSFSFHDLTTDVQVAVNDQIRADLSVRTISLYDTRENSETFFFKTVLRPIVSDEEHQYQSNHPVIPSSDHDQTTSSGIVDLHGCTDQLSLLFEQSDANTKQISVILRSVCVYVSMDVIMEIVSVSIENVNAILQLVQPIEEQSHRFEAKQCVNQFDSTDQDVGDNVVEDSSGTPPISLMVSVRVPNPQLIFLEDPTTERSKAIVFRSNLDCFLVKNNGGDESSIDNEEVTQSVNVSLYDMELFMLSDMSTWQPHQILTPVRIETGLTQTFSRGVLMTTSACINVDEIKAAVSLNDIVLIQSIIMRRSLSTPASSIERNTTVSSQVDGNVEQQVTHLVIVKAVLNMRQTTLTLVNDFHGFNTPIIRFNLEDTAFKVDGFMEDLVGTGFFTVKIDYFNSMIVEWEPVLEPWQPDIELKSNSQEVNMAVVTNQTLQLNVTSTLLEVLSSTYAMLVTHNPSSPVSSRRVPPTITFVNELGITVSLFNNSSKDCIFVLKPRESLASDNDAIDCSKGNLFVGKRHQKSSSRVQQSRDAMIAVVADYPEYIDVHIDESTFTTDQSVLKRLCTTQINTSIACPVTELSLESLQASLVSSADSEPDNIDHYDAGISEKEVAHKERVTEEAYEYQRYNPMIFSKGW